MSVAQWLRTLVALAALGLFTPAASAQAIFLHLEVFGHGDVNIGGSHFCTGPTSPGFSCTASTTIQGSTTTLTAIPTAHSTFEAWFGCDAPSGNQCTMTYDTDKSVIAQFAPIPFPVTVSLAGAGTGSVTSDFPGIDCGSTCTAQFDAYTSVTLTPTPALHSVFAGWSGDCTGMGGCVVTIDGPKAVTATFDVTNYALNVARAGTGTGTVNAASAGIDCGVACSAILAPLTPVTLTASPTPHSTFSGWSGACSGTGDCVITMDMAKSVTATFTLNSYELFISRSAFSFENFGTITSTPAGIACGNTCSVNFPALTQVTLNVAEGPNGTFGSWSGACSGTGPCVVTMDGDKSLNAHWEPINHTITAVKSGSGDGTIQSNPGGILCPSTCSASFMQPTAVVLTATPASGSAFGSWSGCDSVTGNQCTVAATAARTVTASFVALTVYNVVLEGWQESPYVVSPALGGGTATYDPVAHTLKLALTYPALSGAETTAKIHGPALRGNNAPALFTLAVGSPKTDTVTLTSLQETLLQAGQLYVNVSTATHSAGEIRGQIDTLGAATKYTLTVNRSGAGGSSVAGTTEAGTVISCTPDCTESIPAGKTVTLVATPGPDSALLSWTNCDTPSGNTCTVTMTANRTVTATFGFAVTFTFPLEGWQVVAPYVITNATGTGTAVYTPQNHKVTISIAATGLSGPPTAVHLHDLAPRRQFPQTPPIADLVIGTPATITLTADQEGYLNLGYLAVDVHTAAHPQGELRGQIDPIGATVTRTLTVTTSGNGGIVRGAMSSVDQDGNVIDCGADCTEVVPSGRNVNLTALPNPGSVFLGWSGPGCTGTGVCHLTVDADKTITASFEVPASQGSVDLVMTQSASPNPASSGKDVMITLTATNNSANDATNITVLHTLLGAANIWAQPGCALVSSNVICQVASLAAGASVSFLVVARPVIASPFMSNATASATEPEASSGNNYLSLTVPVNASPAGSPVLRYRLYSDVTKEHHFTTDLNEYNVLGTYVGTWVQEGTVGSVLNNPGSFGGVGAVPYYRLYDNNTRWHHWTTDANEYYTLGLVYSGWSMEGVDGYILPTQAPGTTQLYRLNYPALGALHHWTIDANEYNTLITPAYGWVGEGGSGFVVQ